MKKAIVKKPGSNYPTTSIIPVDGISGQYEKIKPGFNKRNKKKKH